MSDTYTEFGRPTGMDTASISSQGYGMVQYGPTDDKLIVGFYRKSVLNQARSRAEGRPIHESHDFIKIMHPGEKLNVVDRPVTENDKHRWPRNWHHYQQGLRQTPDGVPINLLFPAQPEIETMLRGYNIHTVEQLSNLSAEGISTVGMGAQDWVNKAKRYMENANKGVNHHEHEIALSTRDAKITALERQVSELSALIRSQQQVANPQPLPQSFDTQTAQINATHQSVDQPFTPEPAQFVQDLSGMTSSAVNQPKRRGRPPRNSQH